MSIFKELGIREGKDRENEEVVYSIVRAYAVIDRAISEILSEYKLSVAKFNILLMVKHVGKDKGIAQNEISKLLLVTTSNMTRMIDKLEKQGLVARHPLANDRRVRNIIITEKGSELLDRAWFPYKDKINKLVNSFFSDKQKKEVVSLLTLINGEG
ncbi:MAG: MarR family transcriptional regulator [Candidatus Omnitrophica bacterium]|nr:MarR family transcriptional regulator [Candidatus Omnitrophota bacterium]